tara:strand:+ start:3202 stop:4419 length:1218 start_codon:yes stop_codon:yes gene_type:complete
MQEGFLATPHAIRFAVTYLVFQAVLVIFTISSAFRIMTYHLYFHDVDVSKMISIPVLWEIVQYNRVQMFREPAMVDDANPVVPPLVPDTTPIPEVPSTFFAPTPRRILQQAIHVAHQVSNEKLPNIQQNHDTWQTPAASDTRLWSTPTARRILQEATYAVPQTPDDELRDILESYVTRQTPAIHLYSGMFDSRFVLHAEIENLLHRTVQESFPFKLQIDSLDSVVLLYSLSLAFIGFLFYNLHQKARTKEQTASASDVSDISGDFLLFDMLFWANLTLLVFVMFDVSCNVSSPLLSAWQAFVYTILLYVVCLPNALQRHAQVSVMVAWSLHVLMVTGFGHAGVDNGGVVLIAHLFVLVFTYVSTTEAMTELKFLNLRVWCAVFLNVLFLFLYLGNVELITNDTLG